MKDLATMAHVMEQLPQIKEILDRFGLDAKVTHVNKLHCDEERKSFCVTYKGRQLIFEWFGSMCGDPDWIKDGETIRTSPVPCLYKGRMESWGIMVYVGDE